MDSLSLADALQTAEDKLADGATSVTLRRQHGTLLCVVSASAADPGLPRFRVQIDDNGEHWHSVALVKTAEEVASAIESRPPGRPPADADLLRKGWQVVAQPQK